MRKISWRREWLPTPVFLPGESHGQRSLAGYSPWGHKKLDTSEQLTLSRLRSTWPSPGLFSYFLVKSLYGQVASWVGIGHSLQEFGERKETGPKAYWFSPKCQESEWLSEDTTSGWTKAICRLDGTGQGSGQPPRLLLRFLVSLAKLQAELHSGGNNRMLIDPSITPTLNYPMPPCPSGGLLSEGC